MARVGTYQSYTCVAGGGCIWALVEASHTSAILMDRLRISAMVSILVINDDHVYNMLGYSLVRIPGTGASEASEFTRLEGCPGTIENRR